MATDKINKQNTIEINTFVLYSTSGCHLCDEALSVLNDLHTQMGVLAKEQGFLLPNGNVFKVSELDIANDSALIERYGNKIPVLRCADDNAELCWPFDVQQAYEYIAPRLVFAQS